jgi:hypothetical protein
MSIFASFVPKGMLLSVARTSDVPGYSAVIQISNRCGLSQKGLKIYLHIKSSHACNNAGTVPFEKRVWLRLNP